MKDISLVRFKVANNNYDKQRLCIPTIVSRVARQNINSITKNSKSTQSACIVVWQALLQEIISATGYSLQQLAIKLSLSIPTIRGIFGGKSKGDATCSF